MATIEQSFSAARHEDMADDDLRDFLTSEQQEVDLNKYAAKIKEKAPPIKITEKLKNRSKINTTFIDTKKKTEKKTFKRKDEDDKDEENNEDQPKCRAFVSGTVTSETVGETVEDIVEGAKKRGRKPKKDVVETQEEIMRKKRKKFSESLFDFSEAFSDGTVEIHLKIPAASEKK